VTKGKVLLPRIATDMHGIIYGSIKR